MIWSFQGQRLYSDKKDRLFQFLWRPRPIVDAVDASALARVSREDYAKEKARERLRAYLRKKQLFADFDALEREAELVWAQTKAGRQALGIVDDEDLGIIKPVAVDVVLSERVEGAV